MDKSRYAPSPVRGQLPSRPVLEVDEGELQPQTSQFNCQRRQPSAAVNYSRVHQTADKNSDQKPPFVSKAFTFPPGPEGERASVLYPSPEKPSSRQEVASTKPLTASSPAFVPFVSRSPTPVTADVSRNLLPVSALPFTLRSSSLNPSQSSSESSLSMAGGITPSTTGTNGGASSDPLGGIQNRERDIRARLEQLRMKIKSKVDEQHHAEKAQHEALVLATEVARVKGIENEHAASDVKQLQQDRQAEQAKRLEQEREAAEAKRLKEERDAAEAKRLQAEREAKEAKRLQAEREAKEAKRLQEEREAKEAKRLQEEREAKEAKRLQAEREAKEAKRFQAEREATEAQRLQEEREAAKARQRKEKDELAEKANASASLEAVSFADEAEADEVRRLEAELAEIVSREEAQAEAIAREAEITRLDQERARAILAAALMNKLEVEKYDNKIADLEGQERARRKARDLASRSALEKLIRADAQVKEFSKDKADLAKMVEKANAEFHAAKARLDNLDSKFKTKSEQLAEGEKVVDDTNAKIDEIHAADLVALAAFNEKRKEMIEMRESLKLGTKDVLVPAAPSDSSKPDTSIGKSAVFVKGSAVFVKGPAVSVKGPAVSVKGPAVSVKGPAVYVKGPAVSDKSPAISAAEPVVLVEVSEDLVEEHEIETAVATECRRIKISGLPSDASVSSIASIVWGGIVEEIRFKIGTDVAEVLFLKHEDCDTYLNATTTGIKWPGEPSCSVTVEKMEPEPAQKTTTEYIENGVTRCVRVIGADDEWGKMALQRVAAGSTGRITERIVSGQNTHGRRVIDFRFVKIADAVMLKEELDQSPEWEETCVKFGPDPCAVHIGVHTGLM